MGGVVVGGGDRAALESDDDMRLLEPLLHHRLAAAIGAGGGGSALSAPNGASSDSARATIRSWSTAPAAATIAAPDAIVAAQIGGDRGAVEAADALAGAENRPADRLIAARRRR